MGITRSRPTQPRARGLVASLLVGALALVPSSVFAADASASPTAPSPVATLTSAEALCDGVADLQLIVGFLRETDVSEDGWLPLLVGAIAGLGEARQLVASVDETYRPLVEDLIASLQGLRSTVDGVRELETLGAQVAVIGEAITDVGIAMDALSVRLRTPCPSAGPVAPGG